MAEQYTSIRTIQDKLARHPLLQGVTLDAVVDYAVDFMRIVGVPNIFINKVVTAETNDHRIKLPCDYIRMVQMRGRHGMYRYATDTFHEMHGRHPRRHGNPCSRSGGMCGGVHYHELHCDGENPPSAEHVERHLHRRRGELCDTCGFCNDCDEEKWNYNSVECVAMLRVVAPEHRAAKGNYYTTQNSVIFLSHRHDVVDISYLAVMTDNEGFPMIPDDSKFIRALVNYIKKEYFTVLFDTGQIQPVQLQQALQDYAWSVGAAQSAAHEMDLPRLEALSNAMHGLINRNNEWDSAFVSNGAPEILFKH